MPGNRVDKVAESVHRTLSEILLRETKDPDLGMVTIIRVTVSRDLRYAKVFYSVLGDAAQPARTKAAFDRAKRFLRGEVGHRLSLRLVPELTFQYDDSSEYAIHIDELIKQAKNK